MISTFVTGTPPHRSLVGSGRIFVAITHSQFGPFCDRGLRYILFVQGREDLDGDFVGTLAAPR